MSSLSAVRPAIATMRNVAVIGGRPADLSAYDFPAQRVLIDGIPVTVGLVRSSAPKFEADDPALANKVLVRKLAFSINFRDKRGILLAATRGDDRGYLVVGSEFVGEVVAIGPGVAGLGLGDRVIGDNSYPRRCTGIYQGLATAHASREYQVLDARKLMKVPNGMSVEVAAGFAVGAQTAYAMLRRLQPEQGSSVLITAAGSNTSLFAINALSRYGVAVYALSRTKVWEQRLLSLGVKELIVVDPASASLRDNARVSQLVSETGGFSYAIDPFCDIYGRVVLDIMAVGGKYVTCGFYHQYADLTGTESTVKSLDLTSFSNIVVKNLQILGNCLGGTEDLRQALDDYSAGRLPVVIDSVYTGNAVAEFFERTFSDQARFGRVIYRYD